MLGIEDYGSDVDSDNEQQQTTTPPSVSKPLQPAAKPAAKSIGLSLPPPSASSSKSNSPSLPPPKGKRGPKKITIGLPDLPSELDRTVDEDDRPPPAKKARTGAGAGSSGLLSMLPAPKVKNPERSVPIQERVLGAGGRPGLAFRTTAQTSLSGQTPNSHLPAPSNSNSRSADQDYETPKAPPTLLPPSLQKKRANISLEDERPSKAPPKAGSAPAVDFFSLGSASSRSDASQPTASTSVASVSSAPKVEEFTPPEPTPTDPYPGYYMLPSGSWAAYDNAYYLRFRAKWQKDYDDYVRKLEKGATTVETADAQEVDLQQEMEKSKKELKEREDRKAITKDKDGEPDKPRMNVKGAKLGSVARSRHQLTTLLSEAYFNREALEEKIAEGRRNRKEAGNKYGF